MYHNHFICKKTPGQSKFNSRTHVSTRKSHTTNKLGNYECSPVHAIQSPINSSMNTDLSCKGSTITLSETNSIVIRGISLDCSTIIMKEADEIHFENLVLLAHDSTLECISIVDTAMYIYTGVTRIFLIILRQQNRLY